MVVMVLVAKCNRELVLTISASLVSVSVVLVSWSCTVTEVGVDTLFKKQYILHSRSVPCLVGS